MSVDVCVIGSGAGAGPLVRELCLAGKSVVVLERGRHFKAAEFQPGANPGQDEIKNRRRFTYTPRREEEPRLLTPAGGQSVATVKSWTPRVVGGSTVLMGGEAFDIGGFADAGISNDDWKPWVGKVAEVMGMSGTLGAPAIDAHPLAARIDKAATAQGTPAFPTPRLALSRPRGNRPAADADTLRQGWPPATAAKSTVLHTVLQDALATGKCEIRDQCVAVEIVHQGSRAERVRYYDAQGELQELKANTIVVAAGAIESARLLLISEVGGPLVGQNLMFAHTGVARAFFQHDGLSAAEQVRGSALQRTLHLAKEGTEQPEATVLFSFGPQEPISWAERIAKRRNTHLWGRTLIDAWHGHWTSITEVEAHTISPWTAGPGTKVSLGPTRDKWGLPVANIHLESNPADRALSKRATDHALAVLRAADPYGADNEAFGLPMWAEAKGTCRLGTEATTSVLDPNCRVHDMDNLYVVDSSFLRQWRGAHHADRPGEQLSGGRRIASL